MLPSSTNDALPKRLQAALMRIRADHPFFGTLALYTEFRVSSALPTAATDGKVVWINPDFAETLEAASLCGLVVHELLHAALQHGVRRGIREALLWNIAADVVVNGMIRADTAYDLPIGVVEGPEMAHLSVEEIYEQYHFGQYSVPALGLVDLVSPDGFTDSGDLSLGDMLSVERARSMQAYWRSALQQASLIARRMDRGFGRDGLDETREYRCATDSELSWRDLLWQFMVETPFDFGGFDRRFIHQGLYLENVIGEAVSVAICIDTSRSIDGSTLDKFMGEIQEILDAYPQIRGELFFADTDLYGPYEFSISEPLPAARGGGGTDFCPFFERLTANMGREADQLAIYFTDGFGEFPEGHCSVRTLWVVAGGGRESSGFPFGEVARMDML